MQRIKTYQLSSFDKQSQHVSQMLARSMISTSSTALALGANTIIPMSLLQQNLTSSMSHLRRVADYVELGFLVYSQLTRNSSNSMMGSRNQTFE